MSMQQAGTGIADRTGAIIEDLKGLEGPLLPILHGIQEEFGYVPQESLPATASRIFGMMTLPARSAAIIVAAVVVQTRGGRGLSGPGRPRAFGH